MNLVREKNLVSKAELAKCLNTSKTAMSSYVNLLLESKMLVKKGKGDSTKEGGKKPTLIGLNESYKHIIGVLIKVDKIVISISNFKGEILYIINEDIDSSKGPVFMVNRICELVKNLY